MNMFKVGIGAIALVALLGIGSCSVTRVEPGHTGIKVDNLFGNGVDNNAKGVGYYFTPPGVTVYEYPTFANTKVWAAGNPDAGEPNEQFNFQDKNGLSLSADVSAAYNVDSALAPKLFQTYRMDMDRIVAGPLRNNIRNAIVEEASKLGVEEIYGPKKAELIAKALKNVQRKFGAQGLMVTELYWASDIRLPKQVMAQINQKIANEQAALAAQANVAKAKAEAESKVAEATGEAEAMRVRGEAIRTNPEILQQEAIKKWNGDVPQVITSGATTPFINLK